ncbi:MAG: TldD/PmbA family protein [Pseudomonadota bacterium]
MAENVPEDVTRATIDIATSLVEAAKRAGASDADAIVVSSASDMIGVADAKLEEAERAESVDLGLRVLIGQRQACVSSSNPDPAVIEEMVARAMAIAAEAPEDPHCGLLDPGDVTAKERDLDLLDPTVPPDAQALEHLALEAEAAALAVADVTQVESASAMAARTGISLAASNGFAGSYARTTFALSVSAIAGSGLGRERDWASESRRHFADLPGAVEIGTKAGQRAAERLSPRRPPAGSYPVLYDVRVAPGLIRHLLSAINGSAVARGASWLREAMGEAVLPKGISLIDDPLTLRGLSSSPFDAEGVAARRQHLVEDGVLKSWVLDAATARKLDMVTTGHARRGTTSPPSPGISNVTMETAAIPRDELIRQIGTGLIVTSMIGSSVNATTGAYSRGASGFWVEGGEIAYPVNEITVAGQLPEIMQTIQPADDAEPHRSLRVPSLLVEGLTIGA